MYDFIFVHVRESAADTTRNLNSVTQRHRTHFIHHYAESFPLKEFRDNIRSALVWNFDKFEDVRMIQHFPNLGLALESSVRTGIRFELHVRNLNRNDLPVCAIKSLKNGSHSASRNYALN